MTPVTKRAILIIVFLCITIVVFYWLTQGNRSSSATPLAAGLKPGEGQPQPSQQLGSQMPRETQPQSSQLVPPDRQEFLQLLDDSRKQAPGMDPLEKKCEMYQEFRRLNFHHPAVKRRLCANTEAYKVSAGSYPLCQLPSPFDEDMLNVVKQGSDIASLLDMQNVKIPMFVYKGTDMISNQVRTVSGWEPKLVHWILRFTLKLRHVTFVDLGSNIGVYSLQAAKLGLPVVAVDANIKNLLRLRLSLDASWLNAALVWNYIAPGLELKYLNFPSDCNVGGAGITDKQDLADTIPVMPMRGERLGQLIKTKHVVMKIDIQGGESDFLRTSGSLFTDFKVAAVQMEWQQGIIHGNGNLLTAFFTERGYRLWRFPELQPLDPTKQTGWGDMDILWVRQDFVALM